MKNILTRFATSLLSNEQMKQVKGGYGDDNGPRPMYCGCNNGTTITTDTSATGGDISSICGSAGVSYCITG